jgi:hypothetical protein
VQGALNETYVYALTKGLYALGTLALIGSVLALTLVRRGATASAPAIAEAAVPAPAAAGVALPAARLGAPAEIVAPAETVSAA